jgi:hypothetical protein
VPALGRFSEVFAARIGDSLMKLLHTVRVAYLLPFLLIPPGVKGDSTFAIIESNDAIRSGGVDESKSSRDVMDTPVLRRLTEEAQQLTRLRARLLQPIIRREAAMIHPVNGYELVELALTKQTKTRTILVRPFAVQTPRLIFQHQRIAPNFVLPVVTAE